MNVTEAIEYLLRCADGLGPEFDKAVLQVSFAVRDQLEAEKNEPLTREELSLVTEDNPVLVYCVLVKEDGTPIYGDYCIFNGDSFANDVNYFRLNDCGKKIIVYRRKPKEAML